MMNFFYESTKPPKSLLRNIGISVTKNQFRNGKRKFVFSRAAFRVSRIFVSIVFVLSYVFVFSYEAHATAAGLGVTRAIMDFEILIGDSHSDRLNIINNSTSTPLPVHIDLQLWNLREDADDIEFVTVEDSLNATRWFDVPVRDFILEPQEERTIYFTITLPTDTPPGSYFVMMHFVPNFPDFYFAEEGPRFIPEIGSLIFIKAARLSLEGDDSLYSAEITSLKPSGTSKIDIVSSFLPKANAGAFDSAVKTLVMSIKNNGVFHFKASGNVQIKNIFGRVITEIEIPPRYLLPARERPVDVAVLPPPNTETLPFLQRAFKSITYNLKTNTYFGPYRAVATLNIPESDLPVVKTVNFWVIPWKFWLVIGVLSAGSILIVRKFGNEIKKRVGLIIKILTSRNKTQK